MDPTTPLPTGTVTFLLTDIEGSTRLWEAHPEAMAAALDRHDALAAAIIAEHRGTLVKHRGEGDSLFAVFAQAHEAIAAACALQRELHAEPWPDGIPMRVRIALHTGDATLRDGDYFGTAVNRCARLRAAGHGGQILLSAASQERIQGRLPEGTSLRDLGECRLRDLARPERVFQLLHHDLPADFPPLNTVDTLRRHLYTSQMNLAQQAWEAGDLVRARELLEVQRPRIGEEDLRGFEWRYLWRLCRGDEQTTLRGHSVSAVAFSPDGQILATGSPDRTVKLWDVAATRELATLCGHEAPVSGVAFSPDGRLLATVSGSRTGVVDHAELKLWEVAERRELASYRKPGNYRAIVFSPDGKTVAAVNHDEGVRLWDAPGLRPLETLPVRERWAVSVAFSPDGRLLAMGGWATVTIWDIASRQVVATLRGHTDIAFSVAFSPDGRKIVSACGDHTIRLWDVAARQELSPFRGHRARVFSVAFSPDGQTLASASEDSTVRLWDPTTGREMRTLRGHLREVRAVVFAPDGRSVATAGGDGIAKLWQVGMEQAATGLPGHTDGVSDLAFSPDSCLLASAGADRTIRLWEVASGREVARLIGHTRGVHSVAFSPDGQALASGWEDLTIRLWDAATWEEAATLEGHAGGVGAIAFSPDGTRLASIGNDDSARLWDVATRRAVAALCVPAGGFTRPAVAFSPDGKILAVSSHDHTVKLWEMGEAPPGGGPALGDERRLKVLKGHSDAVCGVAFSPDGKTLATTSSDRCVKLWDVATQQEIATLRGHVSLVDSAAFAPDGKTLATSGADNLIKLWDVRTNQEVATLSGHTAPVRSVAFAPDGNLLASASADGTVRLWRAATFAETDAPEGARPREASR